MDRKERVVLTVDAVIVDAQGLVLLMERGTDPYRGSWVLPGGLVDPGETVEQAAVREVLEETGLEVRLDRMVGVFSAPGRDPRGSFVSIAYTATVVGGAEQVTAEARAFRWGDPQALPPMGFDHAAIIAAAMPA